MSALGRYSDALESKWATVGRFWQTPDAPRVMAEMLAEDGCPMPNEEAHAVAAGLGKATAMAEVYWVGRDICALIVASAASLPPASLSADLIPCPVGWVLFERPLPIAALADDLDPCVSQEMAALSWAFEGGRLAVMGYAGHHPHGGDHAASQSPLVPAELFYWVMGRAWDDAGHGHRHVGESARAARYIYTLLHFLSTTILERQSLPAERHVRKRLARERIESEPIQVVQLRRRSAQHGPRESGEPVEWSCQWIVRGHWRQHWMSSISAHQPRWILPHVKGPEGKPLKASGQRVFAVVR